MRYLLGLLLLWCLGCGDERPPLQSVGGDDEVVFAHDTFVDAGFERAVRQALAQPEGALAAPALAGLQKLDAGGYEIVDVQGLEQLHGLEMLLLGDNAVGDIAPLEGLRRLLVLDLSNNALEDIAPLANLLLLNSLNLDGNQVADLQPLARLTLLSLLNLYDNQVSDIAVLSRLRRLESVELSGNPLDLDQVETLRERVLQVTFFQPTITFQDAQLERSVRSVARKRTENLTVTDLRGITSIPHNWHGGGTTMANAHFVAGIPNGEYCELNQTYNPLKEGIFVEPLTVVRGVMELPDKPGFGMELVADVEKKFPYVEGGYTKPNPRVAS